MPRMEHPPGQKPSIASLLPEVVPIEDLVNHVQLSRSLLDKRAQDRRLPGRKVGRRCGFRKELIDQWLESADDDIGSSRRAT